MDREPPGSRKRYGKFLYAQSCGNILVLWSFGIKSFKFCSGTVIIPDRYSREAWSEHTWSGIRGEQRELLATIKDLVMAFI